ncbi:MAG: hypothetical protein ABIP48_07530 [Planctomycetota bacterium]
MTTPTQATRALRLAAIVDGAHVRSALGQAALYDRRNGEHVVTYRGRRFVGATVDAVIQAAKGNT